VNIFSGLWATHRLNRQFYHWNTAALQKHQEKRLDIILANAQRNSPYYNKLLSGQGKLSLASFPRMDKGDMMNHFDELNTVGLRKNELIEFQLKQEQEGTLNLYDNKYSVGVSSGTSGNKGLTVLSKNEREGYSLLLWVRNGIPRHIKERKVLFTLRTNNPAFMEVQRFGIQLVYADYTRLPEELIGLINSKKLNILAGPPSLLSMIAKQNSSIDHRIEAIISYAEVLTDEIKEELAKSFGAPVFQIYQGSEGFIASSCRLGRLHLNEDVVLVELEDTEDIIGKAKNVVLTDLYRTTQPIIRYSLNDILEISTESCKCGSCFRVIERIHGRANDVFLLKGTGGKLHYLFPDYVQKAIIHSSDAILEYQAIQHSIDSIEIRLVLKDGSDIPAIEKAILDKLLGWANKVGGELGKVVFTDKLPERNPHSKKLIRVMRAF
jgi:putative adenylate-forming enzyme